MAGPADESHPEERPGPGCQEEDDLSWPPYPGLHQDLDGKQRLRARAPANAWPADRQPGHDPPTGGGPSATVDATANPTPTHAQTVPAALRSGSASPVAVPAILPRQPRRLTDESVFFTGLPSGTLPRTALRHRLAACTSTTPNRPWGPTPDELTGREPLKAQPEASQQSGSRWQILHFRLAQGNKCGRTRNSSACFADQGPSGRGPGAREIVRLSVLSGDLHC